MDVFGLRRGLLEDYRGYVTSFLSIRDDRISEVVDGALEEGLLWPPARVQLNPAFAPGGAVDDLVAAGRLHPTCSLVFRAGKSVDDPVGKPLRLHRHQAQAIDLAANDQSYVLTTGTGSGKSLSYIVPIVDLVLREGSGKGVRAIVVYPMNALANSQMQELEKFLAHGVSGGAPVRVARYTGQEDRKTRDEIRLDPPDVILTNYVMLELLLTRPYERKLVREASNLRFLVLDELHTYRGRQGSDVAMLVRRVREASGVKHLQCVGTSATLAGPGTPAEQRAQIATVASRLFGTDLPPDNVVGETLRRSTAERDVTDPGFIGELTSRVSSPAGPPADLAAFRADPLAIWLEDRVGIARDPATGDLRRADPLPVEGPGGLAEELAQATGHPAELCRSAIEATLMRGQAIQRDDAPFPVFAFRVHQFISRGDTAYATIESPDARYITVNGRSWAPGGRERRLFPLVFCRECGQEYYAVQLVKSGEDERLEPRDPTGRDADKTGIPGYLYASPENPWPTDPAEVLERVPDDWLEANGRLKSSFRGHLPQALSVAPRGEVGAEGVEASFMPSPFRMCLCCGVAYSGRAADFGKVGTLGSEGRSTATTIIGGSLIRGLREDPEGVPEHARKLLSFTDNRQDASLQAGHFNDFVEVGVLRAGLFQALSTAGPEGVEYDLLAARVAEAMNVPMEAYAANPSAKFGERESVEKVFREVVGYRTYLDQQRGWRITSPNLEQTGLLHISYKWLTSACEADEDWKGKHPALAGASPQAREAVARILLDTLRRELAIEVMYLDPFHQEQIAQRSGQFLAGRWALDPDEPMTSWSIAYPRPRRQGDSRFAFYLSARGGFGRLLRRTVTFPDHGERLSGEDAEIIMRDLLEVLADAGLVRPVDGPGDVPGYRVNAGAMVWRAGEGIDVPTDPVRTPRPPSGFRAPNSFFLDLYRREALEAPDLEGREHTAQVPAADREDREQAFRQGRLPVLFCSPTMELGVDISELNVVNMRNVPPTPANYAQRSGRAGRSGQPALVVTYCSTGSPHDQYFFRRPQRMVAGQVAPPRLDLGNEDLVRAHVHALWLAETGADLGSSLADVLDLAHPDLPVRDGLATDFASEHARVRALARASGLMASVRAELGDVDWFHDAWLDDAVNQAPRRFDEACDRWRSMYRAAQAQRDLQDKISADVSRPMDERRRAERLRGQAVTQLYLLESRDEDLAQSDFYSYRYFASEGFLPGYSFPRLPLAAFIPARRRTKRDGDYISRPRFLAISEFGPRSVIYHEGARYVVNQVTLPIETSESGDSSLPLREAKRCDSCGYLHEVTPNWSAEICDHCGALLGGQLRQLLRLTNVSTRRRQRITSDEEERMRLGYEIVTGLRFATRDGHEVKRLARATDGATPLVQMAYGPAATIWRINLGWRRRSNPNQLGFVLDTQSGYWARNEEQQDDQQDPMSAQQNRVVPFVEDRRNLLTLTPAARLDTTAMLSLMTALTNAVQVVYQLEPSELAAEPLPNVDHPGALLFYESAEGGAGVLRHLTEDAHALPEVARQALRLCHFDPDTGEDLGTAAHMAEACEAACYDCLMSYGNQRFHDQLDRQAIREVLLTLARGGVQAGPANHLELLRARCDSNLEREWLDRLMARGLRLPDDAQTFIPTCGTRPDFLYRGSLTAVYIDGPHHQDRVKTEYDTTKTSCMTSAGYTVLRFGPDPATWNALLDEHLHVFQLGGAPTSEKVLPPPPRSDGPDLDLFDPGWRPLIETLIQRGLDVEPGGDVLDGGEVVGMSAAVVRSNGRVLHLVDVTSDGHEGVMEAIEDKGGEVLSLDVTSPGAADSILDGLGVER